jgi:hypothetical protein
MFHHIRARLERPERHPIVQCPPVSLERRVQLLEHHLAQLWDEVWWHQLPWYRRAFYALIGYRSPITRFYEDANA